MAAVATPDALIGRAAELSALIGALDRAAAGAAGVVLVSGDAGVGKTRLVAELTSTARDRGCMVLVGQCAELGESMPYLPLADALWTATRDPRTPPAAQETLREALRARPVLGRLLPDDAEGPGGDGQELAQQQLFGATLGLLGELAEHLPVVLVLEDLHWADHSTRDLLTFLSRVLQRERVCLIGTYRSDDLTRRHPLRPLVAELQRLPNVSAVALRPFGHEETADYLTALEGGDRPPASVVEQVHTRSEGNPFYAGELFAAARAAGAGAAGGLPTGLADLLLARVERLSEHAQRVVRVAAVAGRRVDDAMVREVSGLDEADCERALREIVSHQLLVPDGPSGYTFRHALLREAVYADLLPGEKTRLHAAFAALLAAAPPGARGGGIGRSAAELAHHSLTAHDLPMAFTASVEAGREAERIGAPADAYEHYDRALSLWDAVPDPEKAAGLDRVHLALCAVGASAYAGEVKRAVTRLRRLLEVVDRGDTLLVAEIRERLAYHLGDLDKIEESMKECEAALALLPADPPTAQRARILATYVRTLVWRGQSTEQVPAMAEEAIATARATGAADAEASALVSLGLYRETRDPEPAAAEVFCTATTLARGSGDQHTALRAMFHYTRTMFDRGDLAGAERAAEDGIRFMHDSGLEWSTYGINTRFMRYLVHYTNGTWDRAAALAAEFGIRVGTKSEAQISAYALFVEVAQGKDAVAERLRWLAPLWSDDEFVAFVARGLAAEHYIWRGDEESGLDQLAGALDALDDNDAAAIRLAATGLWVYADQAVRARAAGDAEAAESAVRAADEFVETARNAAQYTPDGERRLWLGLEGLGWLARAEAEWHRARGDDDPAMWREAVETFDYGFVYEVARSRWRLAEALAERGDREEAAAEWRKAVALADQLGAAPLRRALADLGRRARLSAGPAGPAAPGGGPLASLTSREQEVLRLVAEGRNNKEIAAALFISPKTASVHVSNILAKLGVTSRTQAAAVAHRETRSP